MNMFRFTIKMLAIATFLFAFASLAQAQATRTWVSGVGDDANPCSRTAPCKTWAGAISKTAPCGEIDALDPGGFGTVTITKSMTLDGTGTMASILGAGGATGIIINAAGTDVITVRGLSINGACTGVRGFNILQAKTVNIEDCVIFRFANEGILVTESSDLQLNVRNSVIRDNAGDGVSLTTSSSVVKATLDNVQISGSGLNGLHIKSRTNLTARNCVVSNNTGNGIFVDAVSGGTSATGRIWASEISLNGGHGLAAGNAGNAGSSTAEIAQNQINNNGANGVIVLTWGTDETFTNNSIRGNVTDGCPSCTSVGPGN
jgi:hypothetical protein